MYYEDLGEYGIITFTLKNKITRIMKINMYLLILLFGPKRFFNKNNKMTQIKGRKIIKQQKQNEKTKSPRNLHAKNANIAKHVNLKNKLFYVTNNLFHYETNVYISNKPLNFRIVCSLRLTSGLKIILYISIRASLYSSRTNVSASLF